MDKNKTFTIEKYITESNECPIDDFIQKLVTENRMSEIKKIQHHIKLLGDFGYALSANTNGVVKKIEGTKELYELRPIPNRIFYFHCDADGKYVLPHAFTKKTRKTSKEEIDRAIKEIDDYKRRKNDGR